MEQYLKYYIKPHMFESPLEYDAEIEKIGELLSEIGYELED